MARPKDFHDLILWQKAMQLVREVYLATHSFPKEETFGLKMQIRRAAVSIPANVAEGHGRLTNLQFRHFSGNARGVLSELQTELELSRDLQFLDRTIANSLGEQAQEVGRILNGLIASLPGVAMSKEQH